MDTKSSTCTLPDWKQSQISVRIPKADNLVILPISPSKEPLEPGQKLNLQPVSWEKFTDILAKLNKYRSSRVTYANMILEIMAPLAENERLKVLIADFIKILLKSQNKSWEPFGSTTFKRDDLKVAVEPEACFYIQNYQRVIGKNELDLTKDPAPDLVLETSSISTNKIAAYAALKVSELWVYSDCNLIINVLMNDEYTSFQTSPTFGGVAVSRIIPQYIERAKIVGVTKALAEFESFVRRDNW